MKDQETKTAKEIIEKIEMVQTLLIGAEEESVFGALYNNGLLKETEMERLSKLWLNICSVVARATNRKQVLVKVQNTISTFGFKGKFVVAA